MAVGIKTRGLNRVLKALNNEIGKIESGSRRGIYRAAMLIKKESQKKCPVVTGNLRASAYFRTWEKFNGPFAIIGYSAAYAVFVHESPNAGKSPLPGASTVGESKFLEKAIRENTWQILNLIRSEASV